MKLWTEPGIPDFEGDVFTKECLENALKDNPNAVVLYASDPKQPLGWFADFITRQDLPDVFLAPNFRAALQSGEAGGRLFETIKIVSWTLIAKDGKPVWIQ
jgi:hypothetical protein